MVALVDDGTYWTAVNACRAGPTGSDGITADTGAWALSTSYTEGDRSTHARAGYGLSVYRAKQTHVAASANEPEVGASWDDYWELWAGGGADGAGSGDITGPASATTNNISTFYDTGGKRIKDSGISINNVAFHNLTAFTGELDLDNDRVCILDYSGSTYYKCAIKKIHRSTETISLMAHGMWSRNTVLPSGVPTGVDLPTTRFYLKVIPFSKDVVSYANCTFIMPEYWDGGSLQAVFWGTTATANAGNIRMAIGARVVGDGESLDVAGSTLAGVTMSTHEAAYYAIKSDPVTFTPTAQVAGSLTGGNKILFQICRYGIYLDTLDENFWLTDIQLTYGVSDD